MAFSLVSKTYEDEKRWKRMRGGISHRKGREGNLDFAEQLIMIIEMVLGSTGGLMYSF